MSLRWHLAGVAGKKRVKKNKKNKKIVGYMKRILIFAVYILTNKLFKTMETMKEVLTEEVKKVQRPSASSNIRSLKKATNNLKELELIDEKDFKELERITKKVTDKWVDNGMK